MVAKIKEWLALASVALTFVVGAFFYGVTRGKSDATARQVQLNAKSVQKARSVEDDVRKSSEADVDRRLSKWMRK